MAERKTEAGEENKRAAYRLLPEMRRCGLVPFPIEAKALNKVPYRVVNYHIDDRRATQGIKDGVTLMIDILGHNFPFPCLSSGACAAVTASWLCRLNSPRVAFRHCVGIGVRNGIGAGVRLGRKGFRRGEA